MAVAGSPLPAGVIKKKDMWRRYKLSVLRLYCIYVYTRNNFLAK